MDISSFWRDRLSSSPNVCHGRVCIRGTRVMVSVVLDNLAAGRSVDDILLSYPSLARDDVAAAMHYAAELARKGAVPFLPGSP
ncbi:MAG: DUF433 domain-containing protein [Planctomycetota bacterium]